MSMGETLYWLSAGIVGTWLGLACSSGGVFA